MADSDGSDSDAVDEFLRIRRQVGIRGQTHRNKLIAAAHQNIRERDLTAFKQVLAKLTSQKILGLQDLAQMQVLADDMANDLELGHAESASLLTLEELRDNHTFVADLHIPALGSGVVALVGGCFGAYIPRIHVGGDSFVSSTDAAASHDSIILNKDDLQPRVQNYLNVSG